ncbi:hypothetical protein QAD02_012916 [Eretmocerus hayati]|uniref:Uncharacterized protein n=1 Tax=Eretmocerus hayati TaxID=131215 RepID=A0ACC2P1D8_9HYME|nr:hypothetical protein QAD02_012916 [Eretmocerus hayati]
MRDDQNLTEDNIMSNSTSDESQVIEGIRSLSGLDDTMDPSCSGQSDRLSDGLSGGLNGAKSGSIEDASAIITEFDYYSASDLISARSYETNGATLNRYVEKSDPAIMKNPRVQDIRKDLMNYEQLNDPAQYTKTMQQL